MTNLLDYPLILSTRRNHGLEHATIHILTAMKPGRPLAGRSTPFGFYLYGDVSDEDVQTAVYDARHRFEEGERQLAIHPGCGTNFATTILLAGTLAWLVLRGAKSTLSRIIRIPFAVLFAFLGVLISEPLGPIIQQKITTDAEMGNLQIVDVRLSSRGRLTAHRVITK